MSIKKYKVLSPFLGAGSKVFKFGDIIEEKDLVSGDLKKRIAGKYVESAGDVENTESVEKTVKPKKKKNFLDKFKGK